MLRVQLAPRSRSACLTPALHRGCRWHPFSSTERAARAATRDEPWGPTGTQLSQLAGLTHGSMQDEAIILAVIELRLRYPAERWRNVYKVTADPGPEGAQERRGHGPMTRAGRLWLHTGVQAPQLHPLLAGN